MQDGRVATELIVSTPGCIPVVQAAADIEVITERAAADLWLNMYGALSGHAVPR
jgi:hypothetical protein